MRLGVEDEQVVGPGGRARVRAAERRARLSQRERRRDALPELPRPGLRLRELHARAARRPQATSTTSTTRPPTAGARSPRLHVEPGGDDLDAAAITVTRVERRHRRTTAPGSPPTTCSRASWRLDGETRARRASFVQAAEPHTATARVPEDRHLGVGRRQREGQRLGVGARPQRVGRADRLREGDRERVVGDRAGVLRARSPARSARSACGSAKVPLTSRPGANVLGSDTVSVALPAVLVTVPADGGACSRARRPA